MAHSSTLQTVADGVYRYADPLVNVWVVDAGGRLTVIDAGMPRLFGAFDAALAGIGRSSADIDAVLITHGHPDHLGMAAKLREVAGATVWVHELDAPVLAAPRRALQLARPEKSFVGYLARRPAAVSVPLRLARLGGFNETPITSPATFVGGETLDVPGRPTALATPGHTPGSASFHFADNGVLFTGDALVTSDGMTGQVGPRIVSCAFTHDSAIAIASLDLIGAVDASIVAPGHGEPFTQGSAAAAQRAHAAGPS